MSRPPSAPRVARVGSPGAPPAEAQQGLDPYSETWSAVVKFGEASVYRSYPLERRSRCAPLQARTDRIGSSLDGVGAPNVRRAAPRTVRPP